jgi:hypothetical protein
MSAANAYHSAAMRHLIGPMAAVICLTAACSSSSPSFALTGASVDPTYFCPGGAKDAPYELHATISAHNGTGSTVTVQSVTAEMTLAAVKGDWLEKAGSRYEAGSVRFTPATVAPGSTAALKVTIPSTCTSDRYGGTTSSYGDYQVTMHVTTSAGAFTIAAANQHEIIAA